MTFVDTNVVMYAVGRPHPLRERARRFFEESVGKERRLVISAEILQELLHAYLPVGRVETLDAAFDLVDKCIEEAWSVDADDVHLARALLVRHPGLSARDLLHLACCRRRNVRAIQTFDRELRAAFGSTG